MGERERQRRDGLEERERRDRRMRRERETETYVLDEKMGE